MILKILGTILGFAGAVVGVVSAFFAFFPGNVVGLGDYNRPQTLMHHSEFLGSTIFIISIIALVLTLMALKHHGVKALFFILIVLGAILFPLSATLAASLLLAGGIVGLVGTFVHKNHLA